MSRNDSFAYKLDNNEHEGSGQDNKEHPGIHYDSPNHNNFYDADDEDEWDEYFMKKKSRLRRQNKARDDKNYDEEW